MPLPHSPRRRHTLHGLAGVLASATAPALVPAWVLAQDRYPNKPITLIAPWPPGGSSDSRRWIHALTVELHACVHWSVCFGKAPI